MNLAGVDESFDLNQLRALEFDLPEILGRHDHVLLGFELVTFDDFLRRQRLAALLAFLLVADGAVVVFVELVEPDRFPGVRRVVNADGNRYQGESDMTFPDGSHDSPRFVMLTE